MRTCEGQRKTSGVSPHGGRPDFFFKRLGLLVGSCWVVEADWLVSQRDPLVSDFPRTPAANSCHDSSLFMGVLGLELRTSYL